MRINPYGYVSIAVVGIVGWLIGSATGPTGAALRGGINPINTAEAQQIRAAGAKLSSTDTKFAEEAAQGGIAEVELGKIAQQRGSRADVKRFGQKMANDHTKANQELTQLAATKGLSLPKSTSAKDKATITKLSALSGASFDRAYIDDMVDDHKHDVAAFENYASSGQDPDLKAFASKTLPTLKEHLAMAEQCATAVPAWVGARAGALVPHSDAGLPRLTLSIFRQFLRILRSTECGHEPWSHKKIRT